MVALPILTIDLDGCILKRVIFVLYYIQFILLHKIVELMVNQSLPSTEMLLDRPIDIQVQAVRRH